MSRVADTHVPPALRRWGLRLVLAIVVAVAIGYLPGEILRRDPRSAKLEGQLQELDVESRELSERNATLARQIKALKSDVRAVEDRARSDLGMVYPDEIVIRVLGVKR
ncbi:MAG: septum formation initiator family protein [Deltaproteobacteria bacterium]|nr:septum formation initiator family protein [Deltaproteobacteria bacterium]